MGTTPGPAQISASQGRPTEPDAGSFEYVISIKTELFKRHLHTILSNVLCGNLLEQGFGHPNTWQASVPSTGKRDQDRSCDELGCE